MLITIPDLPSLKRARPFFGPALNDDFLLRIEFNSIASLGVHVAEETILPSRLVGVNSGLANRAPTFQQFANVRSPRSE
jgi:hypothetical protein